MNQVKDAVGNPDQILKTQLSINREEDRMGGAFQ